MAQLKPANLHRDREMYDMVFEQYITYGFGFGGSLVVTQMVCDVAAGGGK
jgi:hypothetical protein